MFSNYDMTICLLNNIMTYDTTKIRLQTATTAASEAMTSRAVVCICFVHLYSNLSPA